MVSLNKHTAFNRDKKLLIHMTSMGWLCEKERGAAEEYASIRIARACALQQLLVPFERMKELREEMVCCFQRGMYSQEGVAVPPFSLLTSLQFK